MKRIIVILAASAMVLFALAGCSSSTATNSANPSSTAVSSDGLDHGVQMPDEPESSSSDVVSGYSSKALMQRTGDGSFADGVYKVGKDIPEGEYQMQADDGDGYFEILSNQSGEKNSVLANCLYGNSAYVSVKSGEYLKTERCNLYAIKQAKPIQHDANELKPGIYKVGFDIPEGPYTIEANGDKVNAGVLSDVSASALASLAIKERQFIDEKTLNVKKGQYLFFDGGALQLNS